MGSFWFATVRERCLVRPRKTRDVVATRFTAFSCGHRVSYEVTDAKGERFVLRRPPLGAVLATAHDMAREYKIITGVGKTTVPVPLALGLCQDESVNDAPFYVMNFVEGHVLTAYWIRENYF